MRARVLIVLVALVSAALTLLAVRSLTTAALAAVVAGLSASAMAGTSKAGGVVAGIHLPAMMGAVAGSMMLALQLRDRSWPERLVLVVASFVAAYFGGLLSAEIWGFGPGGVGVAGTVCAYLILPLLNVALAVLKDSEWIKRMIGGRFGGGAQ